jgi:Fe-S oxidoreductase
LDNNASLDRLIKEFQVFHCVECGKCTGACPLAQVDKDFSPRLLAKGAIEEGINSPYVQDKAWSCLTCGLCHERCPIGILFADFILGIRLLFPGQHEARRLSHGGALQGLMRMQAAPKLRQKRMDWITPDLRISSRGDTLYFVGCLPYFDVFFSDLDTRLNEIAVHTVRILNAMGIEPVVLADERCCGHDLIWSGEQDAFQKLRRLNLESFQKAGVRTIVTACGECSYVLRHLYADAQEAFSFEVMHLSEYLQRNGFSPDRNQALRATYQDPCRLGRFQGVYTAPRAVLGSILELCEMRHFGTASWCCGNSAWLSCDRYSKQLQVERLSEALDTRSDMIVTACPKCQVHLSCAMRDVNRLKDLRMEIRDFSSVVADSISPADFE